MSMEFEQETDGRWICDITDVPGALAYGSSRQEAQQKALAIAIANLPKPTKLHACENDNANCIDFMDMLAGKSGRVCWCECHLWNQGGAKR